MGKTTQQNTPQKNSEQASPASQENIEQTPAAPQPKASTKGTPVKQEYSLRPGQVLLVVADNPEEFLITSKENWLQIYSKSKDGKGNPIWELKEEKKR